jgi:hypothetical protein
LVRQFAKVVSGEPGAFSKIVMKQSHGKGAYIMRRSHPQCSNDSSTAESVRETRLLHNQNAYCRNRLLMLLLVLCVVATSMCLLGANALAQGKSGSAGIWEGDVVAPKWTVHIRLLLKQDKTKLSGWIWETGPGDSVQSAELIGEQVDTSSFRIVTGGGSCIWASLPTRIR